MKENVLSKALYIVRVCLWVNKSDSSKHLGSEIKQFLESRFSGRLFSSHHTGKMVDLIIHAFPRRLQENKMARRLGVSPNWLYKLCRQAFGMSYTKLLRRIWIYQALQMMRDSKLDNTEIALQLNYSEESSMARDFRKELGCSPTEARLHLTRKSPEEILQ